MLRLPTLNFNVRYVDSAAGFATAFNFWISQVALVIFEVTAFGIVIGYWDSARAVPTAVYITLSVVAFFVLNVCFFQITFLYEHADDKRVLDLEHPLLWQFRVHLCNGEGSSDCWSHDFHLFGYGEWIAPGRDRTPNHSPLDLISLLGRSESTKETLWLHLLEGRSLSFSGHTVRKLTFSASNRILAP